ncbi:MAG: SEL1-like repeat protein [Lachnospiraceae bacterium]|nr:SEL1-like repeat protein [Lachnospiraceae bacterium]MBP3507879.1 SEL1-like repeat protein [Lachnospiraceae bacterium]
MKKYLVAGGIGVIGILLAIILKGGVGLLIAAILVILALIIAFGKIGFIDNLIDSIGGSKKQKFANPAEEAVSQAIDFLNQGKAIDAIGKLEEAAEVVESSEQYIYYGCQALRILGEMYETGSYGNSTVQVNSDKSIGYYERLLALEPDGEIYFKVARDLLSKNNFSKGLSYLEKGAGLKDRASLLKLGSIYEEGLYKYDAFGNRGDTVIEINLEKARTYYEKAAGMGDEQGQAGFERVDYALNNTDSIEFEEKEKLYSKISERRKSQNIEYRFKTIEGSKLQYQYTYVHDEVEGYIHKLPKDWVKVVNEEAEEEYYAPNENYKDFAIYVTYDSIPKESTRDLELFLRYDNDVLDYDLNIQEYITEYADGICATYYHRELERGIVTFAFQQRNRLACIKFVCATMEIIEQYEEIIFEVANSFAFVDPTVISDESANRKDQQYYSEAVFYYFLGQYDKSMEFARKALNVGSKKASYLLIELYYDEDSPYINYEKALSLAKQLFEANDDSDLAFLIGTIFEQQKKDYIQALNWYEKADELGHERVPFYLGRLYYYGLLRTKRDGSLALKYFKRAAENGIAEAAAYIEDIEGLNGEELQLAVNRWEKEIEDGNAETALQVAMKKRNQVFYLASEREIDEAFKTACNLGSAEAFYRYGKIVRGREKEGDLKDGGIGKKLLEKALDLGFEGFDNESLCEVVEEKAKQGLPKDEMLKIYYKAAMNGYAPSIEKIVALAPSMTEETTHLYENLREMARKGNEGALTSMNRLERAFPELLYRQVQEREGYKVINNKFFKLSVPKEYTAVIDDEGGTIKIADSVVEFAVAEMPVQAEVEEEFLKVYKLIVGEYLPVENADIMVVNSRMIGSAMTNTNGEVCTFSILLVSAKNQYLFKLSSQSKIELLGFKDKVFELANSLVETGETYVATGDRANQTVGLSRLLSAGENGFLSIGKLDE